LQCNHKDGTKDNNALWNLEYCTSSENQKHAFYLGLKSNRGENHLQNKLKEKEVLEIRDLIKHKIYKQKKVSGIYNVSKSLTSQVINRKLWVHI